MYILLLVKVKSNRKISVRLLSNSLLVPTGTLHPTPLCQIAYVTLLLPLGDFGNVNSAKNSKSISVSINSSANGLTSSNSSPAASNFANSSCDSSKRTLRANAAFLIGFSNYYYQDGLTILPGSFSPHSPEELVLPFLQVICLVKIRQNSGENTNTIQCISFWCKLEVWKGRVVSQNEESTCYC